MKKTVLLIIYIISFLSLFAQNFSEPISREVIIIHKDSLTEADILIKKHNPTQKDNSPYYWYAANNIYFNYGGFSGHLLHGEYIVKAKDMRMLTKGYFKYGRKNGIWKNWYPNGKLKSETEWNDGIKNGKYLLYSTNGVLKEEGKFKKGKKHGIVKRYTINEVIEFKYKKGKLIISQNKIKTFFTKIGSKIKALFQKMKNKKKKQSKKSTKK